jgi:hypothetical protein
MRSRTIILLTLLAVLVASSAKAADYVKVGVVKVAANGPNFIAMGMVKLEVRGDQVFDKRYVVPLATQ